MVQWAILVCAAVFGPYVSGVMTGQAVLVIWGAFILLTGWPLIIRDKLPMLPVIGLWATICAISVIADTWRAKDPAFYGTQPAVHALWWLVMPQLVMIICWYWTLFVSAERLARAISRVIAIGMAANAVLAIMQLSTSNAKLGGVMLRFWSQRATVNGTVTVAGLAATNGRYTGIFDQPAEAGTAYGVALLCIIYLARRGERWLVPEVTGVLVVVGGILSISKIFLFVSLPIAALVIVRSPGVRLRILAGATIGGAALLLANAVGLLPTWRVGSSIILSFLHPNGSFVTLYTADRYGPGGGTLWPAIADVLHTTPWAGFGLRGLNTAYDSQWLEILVLSGLIGVILFCAVVAVLGLEWLKMRKVAGPAESALAGSVIMLAVASSAGFPSLTANRAGVLIWLILGVLLAERREVPRETRPLARARAASPGLNSHA